MTMGMRRVQAGVALRYKIRSARPLEARQGLEEDGFAPNIDKYVICSTDVPLSARDNEVQLAS